jgi:hypothetical protein
VRVERGTEHGLSAIVARGREERRSNFINMLLNVVDNVPSAL